MPDTPQRIQLSRAKGWRMPADTVSVARPGKWGNPFRVGDLPMTGKNALQPLDQAGAVQCFRKAFERLRGAQ